MKAYICDIKQCEKIIRNEADLCHIELSSSEEKIALDLCESCFIKVKKFLNKMNTAESIDEIVFREVEAKEDTEEELNLEDKAVEIIEETEEEETTVEIIEETKKEKVIKETVEDKPCDTVKKNSSEKNSSERTGRKTIAEHIEDIGGIDVLMTAICKKEKSIPEFEAQFGLSKNSLRTYLSMNKISIRDYADKHNLSLGKQSNGVNELIKLRVKEIGLNNILESIVNKERSMEDWAKEIGVTKSQLSYYFHNNYISVRDYKAKKKKEQLSKADMIIKSDAEIRSEVKKISDKASINMGMRTVATGDMKSFETQIDIVSGSCFSCAYRDLDSNTCGYTILTGKSRRGGKGKCCHFVDVNKL